MNIEIRTPTAKDMRYLATHLRDQDQAELSASHGDNYHQVIKDSVQHSSEVWALLVDGRLMFIAGVGEVSLLSSTGSPWLLGTTLIVKHPKVFLSYTRKIIKDMQKTHQTLVNFVDVRNTVAIRYLKHMGFTLYDAVPYGRLKKLFYPFDMVT